MGLKDQGTYLDEHCCPMRLAGCVGTAGSWVSSDLGDCKLYVGGRSFHEPSSEHRELMQRWAQLMGSALSTPG